MREQSFDIPIQLNILFYFVYVEKCTQKMVHDVDGGKRVRSSIVASVSEKKSEKSPEKPSQKKIEQ